MAAKIFVSYRRDDAAGQAGRLFDILKGDFGDRVFQDVAILPGDLWEEKIEAVLAETGVFVLVIGKQWLKAESGRRLGDPKDTHRREIETALQRNIPVVPVLVAGASMPDKEQLPGEIRQITARQAVEIRDNRFPLDAWELVQLVAKLLNFPLPGGQENLIDDPLVPELPLRVKYGLARLDKLQQAAYIDVYRLRHKNLAAAQVLVFLPLPMLGLHNAYLGNWRRQCLFWLAIPLILLVTFVLVVSLSQQRSESAVFLIFCLLSLVWPLVDTFFLPDLVRHANYQIALTLYEQQKTVR